MYIGLNHIKVKLNKRNAINIIKCIAFVTREMYYGKVENVKWEDYFSKENFKEEYDNLRLALFYINELCVEKFKTYKSFRILK